MRVCMRERQKKSETEEEREIETDRVRERAKDTNRDREREKDGEAEREKTKKARAGESGREYAHNHVRLSMSVRSPGIRSGEHVRYKCTHCPSSSIAHVIFTLPLSRAVSLVLSPSLRAARSLQMNTAWEHR